MNGLLATLAHLKAEQLRLDAEWIEANTASILAVAHAEACRDRSAAMDRLYEEFKQYVDSLKPEGGAS